MHPVRRLVVLAPAVALLLTGCGAGPELAPPTGVDELQIPTEDPDPRDFVGTVDNPWFPLEPGRSWTYDVSGETDDLTVTVEPGPEVGGVATTARVSKLGQEERVDWYAQDEDGNVWWFGREGEWEAGRDGAQAGLAMAAEPRLGDGYRTGFDPGAVEETALVLSVDEAKQTEAGAFTHVLLTEVRTELEPALVQHWYYASGVGPVTVETVSGGSEQIELVSYSAG